jgi:hypothetical protein
MAGCVDALLGPPQHVQVGLPASPGRVHVLTRRLQERMRWNCHSACELELHLGLDFLFLGLFLDL